MFIDEEEDEDGRGDVDLETLEDCLPPSDILDDYFVSKLCFAPFSSSNNSHTQFS